MKWTFFISLGCQFIITDLSITKTEYWNQGEFNYIQR